MGRLVLNDNDINNIVLNGKSINRIMLNDEQIWPDPNADKGVFNIQFTNLFNLNPRQRQNVTLTNLNMFNANNERVEYDTLIKAGNSKGSIDPNYLEIKASNSENGNKIVIQTNIGSYYWDAVPANIAASENNYCVHFIGKPFISSSGKVTVGANDISNTINYLKIHASDDVEYITLSFIDPSWYYYKNRGESIPLYTGIKSLTYNKEEVFNHETLKDFTESEIYLDPSTNVTYFARYLFTKEKAYRYYTNNNLGVDDIPKMYLKKRIRYEDTILEYSGIEEATIEDILESDGTGFINRILDKNTDITFYITGKLPQNTYSATIGDIILIGENNEILNKSKDDVTENDIKQNELGVSYTGTSCILAKTIDNKYVGIYSNLAGYSSGYIWTDALGYRNTGASWVTGFSGANSTNHNDTEFYITMLSDYKTKAIGASFTTPYYPGKSGYFALKVRYKDKIVHDYTNIDEAINNERMCIKNVYYAGRYIFTKDDVFKTWCLCGNDSVDWRKIYVLDIYKNEMIEANVDDVIAGKYPKGLYDSSGDYDTVFNLGIYRNTTHIYYQMVNNGFLFREDGSVITLTEIIKPANNTYTVSYDSVTFKTEDGEEVLVVTDAGNFAAQYSIDGALYNTAPGKVNNDGYGAYCTANLDTITKFNFSVKTTYKNVYLLLGFFWSVPSQMNGHMIFNNNGEEFINYPDNNDGTSIAAGETMTVKSIQYVKRYLFTKDTVHITWIENDRRKWTSPTTYLYNKDRIEMVEWNPADIIKEDIRDGIDPNKLFIELSTIEFSIINYYTVSFLGIHNVNIVVEDENGELKLLDMTDSIIEYEDANINGKYTPGVYDTTAILAKDGIKVCITTDGGQYSNNANYKLVNMVGYDNPVGTSYGYLSRTSAYSVASRKLSVKISTNKYKIKAISITPYYQYQGWVSGGSIEYKGKIVNNYKSKSIADKEGIKKDGYNVSKYGSWILMEDGTTMKYWTDFSTAGGNHHGIYLWDKRINAFRKYNNILEIITIDPKHQYERDIGSITSYLDIQTEFNLFIKNTIDPGYNTDNKYRAPLRTGHMLLFDENNELIDPDSLTLVYQSSTVAQNTVTPVDGTYAMCEITDNNGNTYTLDTTAYRYSSGYNLYNVLLAGNTNTEYGWLSHDRSLNNKLYTFNIKSTKKLNAIAWSTFVHSGWNWYAPNIVLKDDKTLWEYKTSAIREANFKKVTNGKTWYARYIIDTNGKVYKTWVPSTITFN